MNKQIIGMLLLCGALVFGSCGKKSQVDELKDFIEQVKDEGSHYTAKQWEEANEKFGKLLEKAENCEDLTPEELEEIARLQGEYAATAFKNQAGEIMEKAGAVINGFLDGLSGDEDKQETEQSNE